jgi:hypothetical protein
MVNPHFPSAFALLLLLSSCTTHRDPRVEALTSLADSIQIQQRMLEQPSTDQTAEAANWAENNLREFELLLDDGNVVVSKEEGRIISDVSRARRLLKDQGSRRTSLPKSAARAMGQLRGLAQAITSGAAKDAAGTPIDSAYIARELEAELAIGRDVVRALEETQQLAERGIAIWQKTAARADSLQTVCRSRLAKAIIEGE